MGKQKRWCNVCNDRHTPPTGKKCTMNKEKVQKSASDVSGQIDNSSFESSSMDSDSGSEQAMSSGKLPVSKNKTPGGGQNSSVSGASALGSHTVAEKEQQSQDGSLAGDVQVLILQELRRVNKRLDVVEEQMGAPTTSVVTSSREPVSKLSKHTAHDSKFSVKRSRTKTVMTSDSSDNETEIPDLKVIRSSRPLQKKIDKKLASMDKEKHNQGNETPKIKSKRGGTTEVLVNNRVSWPQDHILGGPNKQRVSYDQLSLTQFVQGFAKNILEESNHSCREYMLHYLADLMEDANDFSWANAKASHAVLMCEMERGVVDWWDTTRIDRIRRAHAQKHNPPQRQNWGKNWEKKKPWYCKAFQSGTCQFGGDHDVNGRNHKHICANCLLQGRILTHPQKDCQFSKKQVSKNEQQAAQY